MRWAFVGAWCPVLQWIMFDPAELRLSFESPLLTLLWMHGDRPQLWEFPKFVDVTDAGMMRSCPMANGNYTHLTQHFPDMTSPYVLLTWKHRQPERETRPSTAGLISWSGWPVPIYLGRVVSHRHGSTDFLAVSQPVASPLGPTSSDSTR